MGVIAEVRLYRETLAASLARDPRLAIAWTAADFDSALNRVGEGSAHAVVIDMAMHDSLRVIHSMRSVAPELPVVAFAAHEVDEEIIACAEAGVAGFVPAESTVEDLIAAILCAIRGEVRCSPRTAAVLFRRMASTGPSAAAGGISVLTTRERDILALIERGLSNKDIARRLHIQVATVKNHVHHLLEKLHVATRSEAAARHRAAGLPRLSGARVDTPREPAI